MRQIADKKLVGGIDLFGVPPHLSDLICVLRKYFGKFLTDDASGT
jgi:hypothetical protein